MSKLSLPRLRFRVVLNAEHALGPGKADLLEAIAQAGSISAAGRALGMSYKRAWQLVDNLNRSFAHPLVQASKGGGRGGGATLTPTGIKALAAYRGLEQKMTKAAAAEIRVFARLARTH
jgi:molybdate transport system regulatory protein